MSMMTGCFYGAWKNKHACEEYLPVTAFLLIAALYIGGIFQQLSLAVNLLMVCTLVISVGLFVWMVCRDGIGSLMRLCRPAIIMYVLVFLFLALTQSSHVSGIPDEASHWMDIIRAMDLTDSFGIVAESRSYFGTYPPALSLIEFFGITIGRFLTGHFLEPLPYLCFQMTALSLFIPFVTNWNSKKGMGAFLVACVFFALPLIYYRRFFSSLVVDGMVGLLAGFCFVYPFLGLESRSRRLTYYMALFVLCLSKDNGVFFAVASVLTHLIVSYTEETKPAFALSVTKPEKRLFLAALLVVLLSWLSWKLLIAINQPLFSQPWNDAIQWSNLVERNKVPSLFIAYFFDSTISLGTVGVHMITLYVLLMLLIGVLLRGVSRYTFSLSVVAAVYLVGMCFSYLFMFSLKEAKALASIDRYSNTLWLMATFIAVALVILRIGQLDDLCRKRWMTIAFVSLLLIFPYSRFSDVFFEQQYIDYASKVRKRYNTVAESVVANIPDSDATIFLVSQDTGNRDDFWFLRSLIRPLVIDNHNFNLATSGELGEDGLGCITKEIGESHKYAEISCSRWQEMLCESYDYVLLYNLSPSFVEQYSAVFEDPSAIAQDSLYEVLDDGMLRYVPFD